MKKILIAFVLFTLPSLAFAGFSDVTGNHANFEAIGYVQQNNIVNGYPDETFKPDNLINRAELSKILVAANFDQELIDSCDVSSTGFSDVPSDAWFAPYVCVARMANIINGYEDGTFKPAQNVNFVEAAKMISLSFGNQIQAGDVWYAPFVNMLGEKRAVPVTITALDKTISRGEMAEMVYRLRANVLSKESLVLTDNQLVPAPKGTPAPATQPEVSTPLPPATTPESELLPTEKPLPETTEAGRYVVLDAKEWEAALGNKMIALFFHADWCPSCRALDKEINERVLEIPANSVIFKVDYDKETALRKQFGVTQQHTAVFIDTNKAATLRKAGFSFKDLVENL